MFPKCSRGYSYAALKGRHLPTHNFCEGPIRKALQRVIDDPENPDNKTFLDKIIGWSDAKKNAAANALKNKAETEAAGLRKKGYAVEIATADSG